MKVITVTVSVVLPDQTVLDPHEIIREMLSKGLDREYDIEGCFWTWDMKAVEEKSIDYPNIVLTGNMDEDEVVVDAWYDEAHKAVNKSRI